MIHLIAVDLQAGAKRAPQAGKFPCVFEGGGVLVCSKPSRLFFSADYSTFD
jgi:hypothetical protein